ncbi:MAG TPA: histidine kinase [Holophagaceae bacterium]|nr:histidine kinase [Holophagaceae bacterium]
MTAHPAPEGAPGWEASEASEALGDWRRLLAARLRSREVWLAFGLVYAVFTAYNLTSFAGRPGWLAKPEIWLLCWWSPWLWLGGILWCSPIPWQAPLRARGWRRNLLAASGALLFAEAWQAAAVAQDLLLYRHAGIPVPARQALLYSLFITGPVMFLAGYLISRYEAAERGRLAALARAREARVRLLQSQMSPHVLFNSLNGIAELIVKDPPAAEESVRALSDLLRRLLESGHAPLIPLREERAMVESYLSLEALRLGSRLGVRWHWDEALQELEVPPLTLQPLVENAIKHGLAPSRRGGQLEIALDQEAGDLVMSVRNTGKGPIDPSVRGFGIGLGNLRDRLGLVYGAQATLDLSRDAEWTTAEIRIRDFILLP